MITQYYHPNCAFKMFENARLKENVVADISELDGAKSISSEDRNNLLELIKTGNNSRKPNAKDSEYGTKKMVPKKQITATARKKKLRSRIEPAIKIMFANADQLTNAKKDELLGHILNFS